MEDIGTIMTKQEMILEKLTQITADHEIRIRGLEQYKFYAISGIAVLLAVINLILPYIRK